MLDVPHTPDNIKENASGPIIESRSYLDRGDARLLTVSRTLSTRLADAKPLLLVHGAAHNHQTFDVVMRLINPTYSIVTYDARGHAASRGAGENFYTHQQFVDDMAAVIRSSCNDSVSIVASSIGGLHALQLAAQHPDLVKKLVLVDILPSVREKVVNSLRTFFNYRDFSSFEDLVDRYSFLARTRSKDDIRSEFRHSTEQGPNGKWFFKVDPEVIQIVAPKFLKEFQSYVPMVQCPVHLIRGTVSSVVPLDSVTQFANELPSSTQFTHSEIARGGHCPWRENPEEFCRIVESIV